MFPAACGDVMYAPLEPSREAPFFSRALDRLAPFGASIVLLGALAASTPADALTLEEARDRCRDTVGRPAVRSCMQSKGYGPGQGRAGDREADVEACRTRARPLVQACVRKQRSDRKSVV